MHNLAQGLTVCLHLTMHGTVKRVPFASELVHRNSERPFHHQTLNTAAGRRDFQCTATPPGPYARADRGRWAHTVMLALSPAMFGGKRQCVRGIMLALSPAMCSGKRQCVRGIMLALSSPV